MESYHDALITGLERHRVAQQDDDDPNYKPVVLLHRVYPTRLTDDQLNIAKRIAVWAKASSATALSAYSHDNPGWIAAYRGGAGEGARIDMNLAMQQLLDHDPWVHESNISEDERKAFEEADEGEAVEW